MNYESKYNKLIEQKHFKSASYISHFRHLCNIGKQINNCRRNLLVINVTSFLTNPGSSCLCPVFGTTYHNPVSGLNRLEKKPPNWSWPSSLCLRCVNAFSTWPEWCFMMMSSKKKSAWLGLCEGDPPLTDGFSSQRTVMQSFDAFFDLRLKKRPNKQSRRWWFETPSRSLWCHCNVMGLSQYEYVVLSE